MTRSAFSHPSIRRFNSSFLDLFAECQRHEDAVLSGFSMQPDHGISSHATQPQNISPVLVPHVLPRSDTGLIVAGLIQATTRTDCVRAAMTKRRRAWALFSSEKRVSTKARGLMNEENVQSTEHVICRGIIT